MKIFELLAALGNNVLYWDPRSGSHRDWSETGNTVVPTAPTLLTRQGAQLRGTGRLTLPADASLDLGSGDAASILAYMPEGYVENPIGTNYLWSQVGGNLGTDLRVTDTALTYSVGSSGTALAGTYLNKKCLAASWSDGEKPQFFVDGLRAGEGTVTLNKVAASLRLVTLGSFQSYIRQIPSTFGAVLAFNCALTETEQALVYDALEQTVWPSVVSTRSYSMPKIDPNETGLVAGYNMRSVNGKIIDESPAHNDGDIVGPIYEASVLGDSMRFDGIDDYVSAPYDSSMDLVDDMTVLCAARTVDGTGTLVSRWLITGNERAWGATINSGEQNFYISEDGAGFETHKSGAMVDDGLWHMLGWIWRKAEQKIYYWIDGVMVAAVDYAATTIFNSTSDLRLGDEQFGTVGNFYEGLLHKPRVIKRALSDSEMVAAHNEAARVVLYKTDWGARESITGLSNTDFQPISGSHKVITVDYLGEPHKAIQCVTAGAIALPASLFKVGPKGAARGGYSFVIKKALDGSLISVAFVGNQKTNINDATFDGYQFRISDTERAELIRIDNGANTVLHQTAAGAVNVGQFYKIDALVSNAGSFETYIDGVLLDVTGGSGTNPTIDTAYTESKWVVIDYDAGDILLLGNRLGQNGFIKTLGVPV